MITELNRTEKFGSWIYFIAILAIALICYQDYGISWDEPQQRNIGLAVYKYLQFGDREYLNMYDKIYGVGFEMPLVYLEVLFKLDDSRKIYLFRHFMNVVFFAFGCFIFFRLNLKLFKNFLIAFLPALILLFTPRIFGHAFFNSKDIPFLVMNIICFNVLYNYLVKPGYKQLVILAISVGLLINFRIMGVCFFAMVFGIILLKFIQSFKRKTFIHLALFAVISALILYATWPYLWIRPFENFRLAFVYMAKFHWYGTMLFKGDMIKGYAKPGEYLFTWVTLTVPIGYLVLSTIGILYFIVKSLAKPFSILNDTMKLMGWVFLLNALAPVVAVLYFRSVVYDDWRQLYYIYPGLIVFIGFLLYYIKQRSVKWAKWVVLVCFIYIGFVGAKMWIIHPYEFVYFNEAANKSENYLEQNYEMDYWGSSCYNGVKFLAKYQPTDSIRIYEGYYPSLLNIIMLPEYDRNRFVYAKEAENADYYVTGFRWDKNDDRGKKYFKNIIWEVRKQNNVILRVWKK